MRIKCGKLVFNIYSDKPWEIPTNTKKFIESNSEAEISYEIEFVDNIKNNNEDIMCKGKIL